MTLAVKVALNPNTTNQPIFFPRIDGHCDRIHSSLTAVRCFDNGYVGKQPVSWKENSAEYWLKELQESIDSCTGFRDLTEILLKTTLNSIQSINSHTIQNKLRVKRHFNVISGGAVNFSKDNKYLPRP